MKVENILDAIGTIDDEAVQDARTYKRTGFSKAAKWGALAACFGLIFTVTMVTLPGVLRDHDNIVPSPGPDGPYFAVGDDDNQLSTDPSRPVGPDTVQVGDTRAETWLTAEELELGMAKPEGTWVSGFYVPIFLSYRGGFYGIVDANQMDSPRFAPSESENLLFNPHYTHTVYLVEDHPDRIAIRINGMEIYEKIFDVTFAVDGTVYAIAYSPVMNADYGLGDVVLETEDYTVYEAVRLQGETAQTKEYIVDILPILRRERPNFFDGSGREPDGDYADRWQLALPLK